MYINREISWPEFNQRVLRQGQRTELPLLERLKFLSITASNLDEFFQVRVGGLVLLRQSGKGKPDLTGLTPTEQLELIHTRVERMMGEQYALMEELRTPLQEAGLYPLPMAALNEAQRLALEDYFTLNVAPLRTLVAGESEERVVS